MCNMPTCRSQDPSDCVDCIHKSFVPKVESKKPIKKSRYDLLKDRVDR